MQQIVILGGGAAGMAAALAAAQAAGSAARITLLDRNPRCGKKLLATGNGRCNLDNTGIAPECYFTADPKALAPLLAAVMLYAQGESCLQDRVFENRFACAEGFAALGANVRVAERTLYVQPGGTLRGAKLTAPDLRGGAALALAALAARGSSRLGGVEFVRRGYADLDRLLAGLGAQIWQEIPTRSGVVKKTPTKKQFCLAIGAKK